MSATSSDNDWSQLRVARGAATDLPDLLARLDGDAGADARFDVLSALYAHLFRGEGAFDAAQAVASQLANRLDRTDTDEEIAILFVRLVGALEADAKTGWRARVVELAASGPRRARVVALAILSRFDLPGDHARQLLQAAGNDWVLRTAAHFAISSGRAWEEAAAGEKEAAHPLELARLLVGAAHAGSDVAADRLEALREELWTDNWDALASIASHLDPSQQSVVAHLRAIGRQARSRLAPQLRAILAQTRAPAAALELAELLLEDAFAPTATEEDRAAVLAALGASRGAWVYEVSVRDMLERHGLEVAGWDAFREEHLKLQPISEFCILVPRTDGRSMQLARHQRHEEWIDSPWVFYGEQDRTRFNDIAEDDAYFTPSIMSEAEEIMTPLFHIMPDFTREALTIWRFYPHLTPDTLRLCGLKRGWIEVEARVARSTDIGAMLEPSATWSGLSEAEKDIAGAFHAYAAEQAWPGAERSLVYPGLDYLEGNPEFPVSPLALVRAEIDETARATIALSFDSLDRDRRPYLRLTVDRDESNSNTLLFYFDEQLRALLECLGEHLRFMTDEAGLVRFVEAVRPHVVTIVRDRGDGDRRTCDIGKLS